MESEIVTVCAWCRLVRQDDGSYSETDVPSGSRISHGICPDCARREFGEEEE